MKKMKCCENNIQVRIKNGVELAGLDQIIIIKLRNIYFLNMHLKMLHSGTFTQY
jgi:hypothetical protein